MFKYVVARNKINKKFYLLWSISLSRCQVGKLQVWNVWVTNSSFYSWQNLTWIIKQKPPAEMETSLCICLAVKTGPAPRIIFNVWLFTSDRAGLVLLILFVPDIYREYLFVAPPPTLLLTGHCWPMNYNKVLLYCNAVSEPACLVSGKCEPEKQRDMLAGSGHPGDWNWIEINRAREEEGGRRRRRGGEGGGGGGKRENNNCVAESIPEG